MKLAVLGATGKSGEQVVEQALKADHQVKVLVRTPSKVKLQHDNLEVVRASIFSAESLAEGMEGCDAVISCIGGYPTCCTKVTLYSDSMVAITTAMRACGIKRLIAMSAAYARSSPGEGLFVTFLVRGIILRTLFEDCARMEDFLQETASDLTWTAVKPPGLQDKPLDSRRPNALQAEYVPDSHYQLPRSHVARFILEQLTEETWHNKAVAIGFVETGSKKDD